MGPSSSSMKYLLPLLSFSLILGSISYFLNSHTADGTAASDPDREVPVRVTQARRISLPLTIRSAGELRPVTQAEVVSRLAGKVAELRVKVGDYVTAGSVVAVVAATDLEQRIARVEASVAKAEEELRVSENELAQAERQLARDREIFRRDLIARRDVEQAEATVETARAQAELAAAHLAQQQAMLAQVRVLKSLTRLSAPISGEVTSVRVAPGGSVGEGGLILTLGSVETLKLTVSVNGGVTVRPESKARISNSSFGDISVEGEIVRIRSDKSGPAKTSEIEIYLTNRQKYFRPGMPVEAAIDVEMAKESVWIPRPATMLVDGENYVFKITNGRAMRQPVTLGPENGDDIAILEGVQEGESIIVGVANIASGTRVRPVDARAGAASPAN